ncbi:DNA-binding response regulator [Erwinia endophytica]|uniref:response regulator transcription factor n=1 Tax=Erwinia endophytica TaxID=1563158 RepID=UPI00126604A8|nr:LuxR C-terminal-related transcriptional regulator [Erwinia endophytica]KAB8312800.1 DNA-binding response regulator [Erwinia endophytica]
MNILIESKDSFFITGTINLINQAWLPSFNHHPVFLIGDESRSLLTPDIIIADICTNGWASCRTSRHHVKKPSVNCRHVSLTMTSGEGNNFQRHQLRLEKQQAAAELQQFFNRGNPTCTPPFSAGTPWKSHAQDVILSKQQAMVVQYTREGLSLTDISRLTSLSVKTISTHKRAIMRKLGMKNNSEFYQYTLTGIIQR